jgi:ribosome recycling factor
MAYNFSNFKTELKNTEEWLAKEFSQLHTGRATPALLDGIEVESYGAKQPLKNVATISIEDPKTLLIAPWDKSLIKVIEKAITIENLGLGINSGDAGVRVVFPQLTTETRTNLVKVLKSRLEDARVAVRQEREKALTEMKNSDMSEDEKHAGKEQAQKFVDDTNRNLEALFEKKEVEVMTL